MEKTIQLLFSGKAAKAILFDITALAFIYFLPALSHLFTFPFYILEPMRIAVIFCVAHTNRKNTYLIALTLPLFSFLLSSHPAVYKSLLITAELLINIAVFYLLSSKVKNNFIAMIASISAAKIFYYTAKFSLIGFGLFEGGLVSTPLLIQAAVMVALSIYVYVIIRRSDFTSNKLTAIQN